MKFASQFVVSAASDKVFTSFFDPETMQACIPGCEELRQEDEKTYRGRLANEVAHVKFRADFSVAIQSVIEPSATDEPAVVTAILKGEDRRLGSTIKIDATLTIAPHGADSQISYELEMAMWGKLGRLGEPVIRRRTAEVESQFAAALAGVCAGEPIPEPSKRSRKSATSAPTSGTADVTPAAAGESVAAQAQPMPPRDKREVPFNFAVSAAALTAAALAVGVLIGRREREH